MLHDISLSYSNLDFSNLYCKILVIMISIFCGQKITDEEFSALTQSERKRLGEVVRELMKKDRYLTREMALQKAYPLVLAELVEDI